MHASLLGMIIFLSPFWMGWLDDRRRRNVLRKDKKGGDWNSWKITGWVLSALRKRKRRRGRKMIPDHNRAGPKQQQLISLGKGFSSSVPNLIGPLFREDKASSGQAKENGIGCACPVVIWLLASFFCPAANLLKLHASGLHQRTLALSALKGLSVFPPRFLKPATMEIDWHICHLKALLSFWKGSLLLWKNWQMFYFGEK